MAKKKKAANSDEPKKKTLYTITLDEAQIAKLKGYCDYHLWEFFSVDYAEYGYKHKLQKVTVVAYKSGKVVISGKGTEDFIIDVLEAEITGEPRFGYDEIHNPEWFDPHAGLDEAGKGDLFGPLVAATVIADANMVREWIKIGIRDSKKVNDKTILRLEKVIRNTNGVVAETAFCSMAKYNQLMAKPTANLNKLLAWLHAQALESALRKQRVKWGLLDQFSKRPLVQTYYKDKNFDLQMRTKAESDPVVAAASIIARATFVKEMDRLSTEIGEPLLKGASAKAKEQGKKIVERFGKEALGRFAKLHFKTSYEILGIPPPVKENNF